MHVVIQVCKEVARFLSAHLILTITVCIATGFTLGVATYGAFLHRRERLLRRLTTIFQHSSIDSLEIQSWPWKLALSKANAKREDLTGCTQTPVDPATVQTVVFTGDRAGTFAYAQNSSSPLGKILHKDELLCTVTSLGIQQEVFMPTTGLIIRVYKQPGERVLYRDADMEYEKLFDYVPLAKPLT